MNKVECKKYIRRAFKRMKDFNKSMTPENLEVEMNNVAQEEINTYIAYSKIALHTLNKSLTEITAKQLTKEIDKIVKLYNKNNAIIISQKL